MENEVIQIKSKKMVEVPMDDYEEDFELKESKPKYEVWVVSETAEGNVAEFDMFIDAFDSAKEAKKCFDYFSNKQILLPYIGELTAEVKKLLLRLEVVVGDDDVYECIDVLNEIILEV